MSAWIVTQNHIRALLTWASDRNGISFGLVEFSWDKLDSIGQILLDENVKSVEHRYGSDCDELPGSMDSRERYAHKPYMRGELSPVDVIKSCQCLEYQSCEHPEWGESYARRVVKTIEGWAISKLPGYDDAPWGIS